MNGKHTHSLRTRIAIGQSIKSLACPVRRDCASSHEDKRSMRPQLETHAGSNGKH